MDEDLALEVNGQAYRVRCDPSTPLLYILRNDLGLFGAKFGCGLEQCLRPDDHAGNAVAALGGLLVDERLLDRVQMLGVAEPFDGDDGTALK